MANISASKTAAKLEVEAEDIFLQSLSLLTDGKERLDSSNIVIYGPLTVEIPEKEGKANTLLADHLFSPSIVLAECIETGLFSSNHRTVLELGAGCALPSLLLSYQRNYPELIVITDYPDPNIMKTLTKNRERNRSEVVVRGSCKVESLGYEWGKVPEQLLLLNHRVGYDALILSDLLYFDKSHNELIYSVDALLRRHASARVYLAAGRYTPDWVCDQFLRLANDKGIVFEEIPLENQWFGKLPIATFADEQLVARKMDCRMWIGKRVSVRIEQ